MPTFVPYVSLSVLPRAAESLSLFLYPLPHLRHLHSFPTRRSSDLVIIAPGLQLTVFGIGYSPVVAFIFGYATTGEYPIDRKSTRLNSSHVASSYAVFCLKKKTKRS